MEMPVASPAAIPKRSAYARSRTFRLGVWMLAGAVALIVWHGVQDLMIAKRENLRTVEGIVVEERSSETSGTSRVKLARGGTQSIQGNRKLKTVLRIQKRDGTIAEFTASEWFPTPKGGWENQPIRVQHDSLGYLYEIVVAGEVIRDVETSYRNRKIDNKSNTGLWIFLLLTGLPLTLVGYVLSLWPKAGPPPLPTAS
jgi:hypothetical protein